MLTGLMLLGFNPSIGISKLRTAGDGSALGERGEWAMCEHLVVFPLRTSSEDSIASLSRAVKPLQQRSGGFASGSRGFVRASPLAKCGKEHGVCLISSRPPVLMAISRLVICAMPGEFVACYQPLDG